VLLYFLWKADNRYTGSSLYVSYLWGMFSHSSPFPRSRTVCFFREPELPLPSPTFSPRPRLQTCSCLKSKLPIPLDARRDLIEITLVTYAVIPPLPLAARRFVAISLFISSVFFHACGSAARPGLNFPFFSRVYVGCVIYFFLLPAKARPDLYAKKFKQVARCLILSSVNSPLVLLFFDAPTPSSVPRVVILVKFRLPTG